VMPIGLTRAIDADHEKLTAFASNRFRMRFRVGFANLRHFVCQQHF
jgi:hypothetical protein